MEPSQVLVAELSRGETTQQQTVGQDNKMIELGKENSVIIDGQTYYEVEKILDHGRDEVDHEMCYLIKWKNYTQPEWIRRSGLKCPEILSSFEKLDA